MQPESAIAAVKEIFRPVPRPGEFIWGTCYCEECVEHNETLAAHTPDTITLAQLGNAGWDPLCFANHQAFRYYLPALIRLSFGPDGYWSQLLFHLNCDGRIEALEKQEAQVVLDILWLLADLYGEEIEQYGDADSLLDGLRRLEQRLVD